MRETNQIANYAFVEWGDNTKITNQSPKEYVPKFEERFDNKTLKQMYSMHALPTGWPTCNTRSFWSKRCYLIANVIRNGYESMYKESVTLSSDIFQNSLRKMLRVANPMKSSLKSTLRTNLHTNSRDPRMEQSVLKTIAGFLNTNGGVLTIGVTDATQKPLLALVKTILRTKTKYLSWHL